MGACRLSCRIAEALSGCQSTCPKSQHLGTSPSSKFEPQPKQFCLQRLESPSRPLPSLFRRGSRIPLDQRRMAVHHWHTDTKIGEYMRAKCGGGPGRCGNIPVWKEVVCKWKMMCFILPKLSNYRRCIKVKRCAAPLFSLLPTSSQCRSLPPTTSSPPSTTTVNRYPDNPLLDSWRPSGLLDPSTLKRLGRRLLTPFLGSPTRTFSNFLSRQSISPTSKPEKKSLERFLRELKNFRLGMWVPSAMAGRKTAPTMRILYARFYLAF